MSITAYRFRSEDARVILQVQETDGCDAYTTSVARWRDAKVEDLMEVARLMDGPRERREDWRAE